MADDSPEVVKETSEAVNATNLKVLSDGPAFFTNQLYSDSLDARSGWRSINQAVVTKATESLLGTSPAEGGADIAALLQLMKGGYMTPPVGFSGKEPGEG